MAIAIILFSVIVVLVSVIYYLLRRQLSYWKNRNVINSETTSIFGDMKGVGKTRTFAAGFRDFYNKFKGASTPFVGFYFILKPTAFVLDLDLAKNILIKDFSNFADRGQFVNERDDPLTGHLFSVDGKKWKTLRNKLSPTFTSGKMKFMFPTVLEVGERFGKVFGEYVKNGAVVEIKDLSARFTTDVIGTCAFGIECNSLKDPNTEFRLMGSKVFTGHRHYPIVEAFIQSFPDLAAKLRMKVTADDVTAFFLKVVNETVEYREKNNIKRNDFMDMLIELKNNKVTYNENGEEISGMTMNELAAQAFIFFLAGFETSSTTMGFCLYELAQNQEVQDKLRKEIVDVLDANGGELTYDLMKGLQYMDQVINETLRKYAVLHVLFRKALNDYKVPNSDLIIEAGTAVFVPIDAIHYDPEYYPDPEKFDPDRFTPEEIQKRHPCCWMPFGDGPRNCIGLRFGQMQARIGLVKLIQEFKFTTCAQTEIPIKMDPKSFLLNSLGGIYLQVDKV